MKTLLPLILALAACEQTKHDIVVTLPLAPKMELARSKFNDLHAHVKIFYGTSGECTGTYYRAADLNLVTNPSVQRLDIVQAGLYGVLVTYYDNVAGGGSEILIAQKCEKVTAIAGRSTPATIDMTGAERGQDVDGDGVNNLDEIVAGTSPSVSPLSWTAPLGTIVNGKLELLSNDAGVLYLGELGKTDTNNLAVAGGIRLLDKAGAVKWQKPTLYAGVYDSLRQRVVALTFGAGTTCTMTSIDAITGVKVWDHVVTVVPGTEGIGCLELVDDQKGVPPVLDAEGNAWWLTTPKGMDNKLYFAKVTPAGVVTTIIMDNAGGGLDFFMGRSQKRWQAGNTFLVVNRSPNCNGALTTSCDGTMRGFTMATDTITQVFDKPITLPGTVEPAIAASGERFFHATRDKLTGFKAEDGAQVFSIDVPKSIHTPLEGEITVGGLTGSPYQGTVQVLASNEVVTQGGDAIVVYSANGTELRRTVLGSSTPNGTQLSDTTLGALTGVAYVADVLGIVMLDNMLKPTFFYGGFERNVTTFPTTSVIGDGNSLFYIGKPGAPISKDLNAGLTGEQQKDAAVGVIAVKFAPQ